MLLLLLLSRFSRVQLCATPQTAAHQAPPSLGFSRQEYWSWLPFPSPMHACMLNRFSRVQLCATLWTAAHKAPPSTGFSRQEYQSGLPFPPPEKYKPRSVNYKLKAQQESQQALKRVEGDPHNIEAVKGLGCKSNRTSEKMTYPQQIPCTKIRALLRKKGDPETQDR